MTIETLIAALGGPIGLIGLAIAFALGAFFYRLSLRDPKLVWDVVDRTVIGPNAATLDGLRVLYQGNAVDKLSVATIAMWNTGRGAIEQRHIETSDPLRLEIEDGVILSAEVLASTKPASQFEATLAENGTARIRFAYLNRGWGGVVRLVHTGERKRSIRVVGEIMGSGAAAQRLVQDPINGPALAAAAFVVWPLRSRLGLRRIRKLAGVLGGFAGGYLLWQSAGNAITGAGDIFVTGAVGLMLLLAGLMDYHMTVPRGLEIFASRSSNRDAI